MDSIVVNGNKLGTCITKNVDDRRLLVTCTDEWLKELLDEPVIVEATFKVKMSKRAHSINLSVVVPTRGVIMKLDYGDTDIRRVEVIDMFVSGRRPDTRALPTVSRPRGVEVRLREWAFPKGGVVVVWHLEQEVSDIFSDLLSHPDFSQPSPARSGTLPKRQTRLQGRRAAGRPRTADIVQLAS